MMDKADYCSLVMRDLGASIVNSLSPHIAILSENGEVLAVNNAWREFSKLNPPPPHNLAEGDNYLEFCRLGLLETNPKAEAFCQAFQALCNNALLEFSLEFSSDLPTGTRWFLGKMTSFPSMNRKHIVLSHEDITELKQAQTEIHHLAYYDSLTGLPNRLLFLDRLDQAIAKAKRENHLIGLLYLDLDRFKIINDTLGHTAGDQLLQTIAQRLKSLVRESDTVSRLGGDEFTVLLPNLEKPEDVALIARKILKVIPLKIKLLEQDVFPSASIGIALYPNDAWDGDSLITFADMAMYHAKEKGRNNFQFFSRELNEKTIARMKLENQIRRGVQQNEFILFYQPYYEIDSKKLCGVKGLLRWNHPSRGVIPASDILPLLEDSGLWIPLGEWALNEACRQIKSWESRGWKSPLLSMNLTEKQIQNPHIVDTVTCVLKETALAPSALELEIDEQIFLKNLEETYQVLYQLKNKGIKIAINNFGLTYSSLRYIKRLGIDRLKIEPSLIHNLPENPEDAAITEAIITMGKTLKVKVLGKGVEKSNQMEFLKQHQCDEVQGFLFDYPAPGEEVFKKVSVHFQ